MKKLIAGIAAMMIMVCGCYAAFATTKTLSREEAMQAALDFTELKEEQITHARIRSDRDDGRPVWEVRFIHNGTEYELDVDARTGRVVETDLDRDHDDWDDDWFDWDDDRDDDWFDPDDWFDFD